ncbi:MAG: hypothetical protein J1F07_09195 [Muribaculaceae bacterium]|nr:hypothetical protein [Muribaculaceae bacterium]
MKRNLYILTALACMAGVSATAQTVTEPFILNDAYVEKLSPNGVWSGGEIDGGHAFLFHNPTLADSGMTIFENCILGHGNCIALSGLAVGTYKDNDKPAIFRNGKYEIPYSFRRYTMANLQGITADGTRVVGYVEKAAEGQQESMYYYPVYADFNPDGSLGDPVYLPYPPKDPFGQTPQYCTAVWVSDDGRTILGQLCDDFGGYMTPVVYTQDSDGTWSYSEPALPLFNPNHLELLPYPQLKVKEPNPLEYMKDDAKKAEYLEKYKIWADAGFSDNAPYPDPKDYMNAQERAQYEEAFKKYKEANDEFNKEFDAYRDSYLAIVRDSPNFQQMTMALNSKGTAFASTATATTMVNEMPVTSAVNYIFNLTDGTFKTYPSKFGNIHINQLFNNGIALASYGAAELVQSFVLVPGETEFIPIEVYLSDTRPAWGTWIDDNMYYNVNVAEGVFRDVLMTGLVCANEEFSVVTGAYPAWLIDEYRQPYETYIFFDPTAGVEGVVADKAEGVQLLSDGTLVAGEGVAEVCVYNMAGTLVCRTSASGATATGLAKGIYVVVATDKAGNVSSFKTAL